MSPRSRPLLGLLGVTLVAGAFVACSSGFEALPSPTDASTATDATSTTDAARLDGGVFDATADAASSDATVDAASSDATADTAASDAAGDTGPVRPFRYLFATVPAQRSSLSSIAAADALCTGAKPSAAGRVKALLVGPTRTACTTVDCGGAGAAEHVDWPLAPSTEYRRLDGTTVIGTTNAKGLFDVLRASVDTADGFVWTGLAANMANTWTSWLTSPSTCGAWGSTAQGTFGAAAYRGPTFVNAPFGAFIDTCDKSFAIYCAETN